MRDLLSSLLNDVGIELDADVQAALLRYQEFVLKASATQNVTALRSPELFLREGVLDSLLAWRALGLVQEEVLDVGSGSGLPAVVWCLAGYVRRALLIEAERRKGEFLRAAAAEFGLDLEVRWVRAEDEARLGLRDRAPLVTARAVASAPVAVEVCGGLVRQGGMLCLLKGTPLRAAAEAAQARPVAQRMGFSAVESRSYLLGAEVQRTLLLYRKERPTPAGRPTSFARLRREFPARKPGTEREGAAESE